MVPRKIDLQENARKVEGDTEDKVKVSSDIKDDAKKASIEWNEVPEPALSDTKEEENKIAQDLKSDILQIHGEQADRVDNAIKDLHQEVSDPARKEETSEKQAADAYDAASSGNKRFGKRFAEAADVRRDSEVFYRELAKNDEIVQDDSKKELEDNDREVDQSMEDIN